jgi:hypothetical protein
VIILEHIDAIAELEGEFKLRTLFPAFKRPQVLKAFLKILDICRSSVDEPQSALAIHHQQTASSRSGYLTAPTRLFFTSLPCK